MNEKWNKNSSFDLSLDSEIEKKRKVSKMNSRKIGVQMNGMLGKGAR